MIRLCESDGMVYTSNPPQYKCIHCGRFSQSPSFIECEESQKYSRWIKGQLDLAEKKKEDDLVDKIAKRVIKLLDEKKI